jgi:hypothetical protein
VPGQQPADTTDDRADEGQDDDRDAMEPLRLSSVDWQPVQDTLRLTTSQSVSPSWCRAPFWGLMTIFESPWDLPVAIANVYQTTTRPHGSSSQKTAIFILVALRT